MIEMCSPPGYEKAGFGPLVKMKASEIRRMIHGAGLGCESCHFQFRELKENLDDRIAYAKELGLKQMIVATFALRRDATMADWVHAADEMNKLGEQTHKAGIQLGFHNHNFEFKEIDGVLIYDELMKKLDPKLVKMQFQVAGDPASATIPSPISRNILAALFHSIFGLVNDREENRAHRNGLHRLEEALRCGQDGRHKELLRRNGLGLDAGQRPLPSQTESVARVTGALVDRLTH